MVREQPRHSCIFAREAHDAVLGSAIHPSREGNAFALVVAHEAQLFESLVLRVKYNATSSQTNWKTATMEAGDYTRRLRAVTDT